MRPELIVAGKELRDHVTSRRFLIIFAILMLISVYSIVTGMDQYNKMLDNYKDGQQQSQQQDWFKEQVAALQKQIAEAQAKGDSQEMIDSLQYQLDSLVNPPMPSVMTIFYSLNQYFVWICILLAIALGFDLITREKEEGSLKSLLSHPVYRDSVINGKTLGAISVLTAAMGATFLVTIAIILFFGVVPSLDELLRVTGYYVLALLICLAFFAVAMAASTLAKNSSMAVLYVLGIVVILAGLTQFSPQIVSFISGPAPDYGGPIVYYNGGTATGAEGVKLDPALVLSNRSAPRRPMAPCPPTRLRHRLRSRSTCRRLCPSCPVSQAAATPGRSGWSGSSWSRKPWMPSRRSPASRTPSRTH